MYTIAIKKDFIAQHLLEGGDWGPENERHSHHYQVELQLEGETLDQHGYLVDIVEIEGVLNELMSDFRDRTLNELSQFSGLNPSIEHFSRILCQSLSERILLPNVRAITIKLWENEDAWAAYRLERSPR